VIQKIDSILILDDDASFRSTVGGVLQQHGFTVLEAESAKAANAIIGQTEPALVIVDYHLPGTDGVSWISQVREQGRKFPIVFVSADWCDQKTFNWLRNILRVSLILNKPIVADLFWQQVETLLPTPAEKPRPSEIEEEEASNEAMVIIEKLLSTKAYDAEEIEKLVESVTSAMELLEILRPLEVKYRLKKQMALASGNYVKQLISDWQRLNQLVQHAQRDVSDRMIRDEAINASHKIAGSAGTYGFAEVGLKAKKIEELLKAFDPSDTLQEVLWNEIFRCLADGESMAYAAMGEVSEGDAERQCSSQFLLVGAEDRYRKYVHDLNLEFSTNIVVSSSVAGALAKAKKTKFDGAILDLAGDNRKRTLALSEDLRMLHGASQMPFAFVCEPNMPLSSSEAVLYGSSVEIELPIDADALQSAFGRLYAIAQADRKRVLVVDDDPVLSGFVRTILGNEGIYVETLETPITILEKLSEFRPDLVILDVMMPGLSGYDVCRIIRASEFSEVPVLFLTSKSSTDSRTAAMQAGGTDFLPKPVVAPDLVARVSNHIGSSSVSDSVARDPGSGTLERSQFMDYANNILELVKAQERKEILTVCIVSFDDYLRLSPLHSNFSVSRAVETLGQMLQSHFRAHDLKGRWSEDSFVLAFYGQSKGTIQVALQTLLEKFGELHFPSDALGNFKATFSAGIASYPDDGRNIQDLLNVANRRLITGSSVSAGRVTL
jgi:DNA-binding response OmpR family regulator